MFPNMPLDDRIHHKGQAKHLLDGNVGCTAKCSNIIGQYFWGLQLHVNM